MLQIYRFLETQSEPVYRSAIEKAVGFNCTRSLMYQPSQPKQVTMESLGIAELGRTEGEAMIRGLN